MPAALLMRRFGRRAGFILGSLIGAAGAAVGAVAIEEANFWMFTAGMAGIGVLAAFSAYYRFAAADVASPDFKSRAISFVIAGGIVGAVVGPELTTWSNAWFLPTAYVGVYVAMVGLGVASMAVLAFLDIPRVSAPGEYHAGRPLARIMRQPVFMTAVLAAMVSYGMMWLVMTAAPIAMTDRGYSLGDAAVIIEAHVIAMFAPALITGHLIRRFGALTVILTGTGLLAACAAVAVAGLHIAHFWLALVVLGLGWNFGFIGASTLLTEAYAPEEREKVQGVNDFIVFGTVAASSLAAGVLLHYLDWDAVNLVALPFVVASAAMTLWLAWRRQWRR